MAGGGIGFYESSPTFHSAWKRREALPVVGWQHGTTRYWRCCGTLERAHECPCSYELLAFQVPYSENNADDPPKGLGMRRPADIGWLSKLWSSFGSPEY